MFHWHPLYSYFLTALVSFCFGSSYKEKIMAAQIESIIRIEKDAVRMVTRITREVL